MGRRKKEAYSRAIIYFDLIGQVKNLIKKKTKYNKKESYKRLIWIIQQYKWRGRIHPIRACKRGFPEAGQDLLNEYVDLLVEGLYIINERYLPHKKWRLVYINEMSNTRKIIPLIKKVMVVKKNGIKDVKRRIKILNKIFLEVYFLVLKKYPNFPKNPYEFYYRNFIQFNPMTSIDLFLKHIRPPKENFEKIKGVLCYNLIDTKKKFLKLLFYNNNDKDLLVFKKRIKKYKNGFK